MACADAPCRWLAHPTIDGLEKIMNTIGVSNPEQLGVPTALVWCQEKLLICQGSDRTGSEKLCLSVCALHRSWMPLC